MAFRCIATGVFIATGNISFGQLYFFWLCSCRWRVCLVPTNLGINSPESIRSFHQVVMWYEDTCLLAGQEAGWQLQMTKLRGGPISAPAGKSCLLLWDGDVWWDGKAAVAWIQDTWNMVILKYAPQNDLLQSKANSSHENIRYKDNADTYAHWCRR